MTTDPIPGLIHDWPVIPRAQYQQALTELRRAQGEIATLRAQVQRLAAENAALRRAARELLRGKV